MKELLFEIKDPKHVPTNSRPTQSKASHSMFSQG